LPIDIGNIERAYNASNKRRLLRSEAEKKPSGGGPSGRNEFDCLVTH